jgi:hypothetical protein
MPVVGAESMNGKTPLVANIMIASILSILLSEVRTSESLWVGLQRCKINAASLPIKIITSQHSPGGHTCEVVKSIPNNKKDFTSKAVTRDIRIPDIPIVL